MSIRSGNSVEASDHQAAESRRRKLAQYARRITFQVARPSAGVGRMPAACYRARALRPNPRQRSTLQNRPDARRRTGVPGVLRGASWLGISCTYRVGSGRLDAGRRGRVI